MTPLSAQTRRNISCVITKLPSVFVFKQIMREWVFFMKPLCLFNQIGDTSKGDGLM